MHQDCSIKAHSKLDRIDVINSLLYGAQPDAINKSYGIVEELVKKRKLRRKNQTN
jgi:hypothetical protein